MDTQAFADYLKTRYFDQLSYYDSAAQKNQKRYRTFQWVVIVLAALTPVLAALDGRLTISLQVPVVVISATVAILTTGLKTFNYQELWANYRSTHEQLKPEIHYYNLRVGPYAGADVNRERTFVARVEAILDKEHRSWPPAQRLNEVGGEEDNTGPTTATTPDASGSVMG
ncbi:MAG TPA: DUF4231 domain-containing protein [Flavobacteriales bacterium]|nr:DUF4231 domain-containing protein [Flavobacteriales bacterium]